MPNDSSSIVLLVLLYTLQGIPMGLSSSIPFLLQTKVGYKELGTFSLVSWPFSLKLLWAPYVDAMYIAKIGRRKSWLVPIQFVCGLMMTLGSGYVESWLGTDSGHPPNVPNLTIYFFVLYLLMATQDIAVDGWALTMLSKKNVSYASTCNSVGQTLGYFMAYVGFLALNDEGTCNSYFRTIPKSTGMVSLSGFLYFWGMVMLVTTVAVAWLKKETMSDDEKMVKKYSIRETYHQMYQVLCLPAIQSLMLILVTCKVGFAAAEAVAPLKLVEYGLPKEKLAMLSPLLIPLGIVIPIVLSRHISAEQPWRLFTLGYPLRMMVTILYAGIVYFTPKVLAQEESMHYYYYLLILISGAIHEVASNMMFVSMMAFYAKISDPAIGGTYMTFLNTLTNLGTKWPNSLSLFFVDYLSKRTCSVPQVSNEVTCNIENCHGVGGKCILLQDGFFTEIVVCFVIGVLWFVLFYRRVKRVEQLPMHAWRVSKKD